MKNKEDILVSKIKEFKKKLFLKLLLKSLLIFLILVISTYISANLLEYFGNFNTLIRAVLFFTTIIVFTFSTIIFIVIPTYKFLTIDKQIDEIKAANLIGQNFPNIKDKLVNYLQLANIQDDNTLVKEAIKQKNEEMKDIPFTKSINFDEIFKYLKYTIIPFGLLIAILVISPSIFTEGSNRIINYDKTFISKAPFKILIKNDQLNTYQNEDYTLEVTLEGKFLPESIYILLNGRKIKLEKNIGEIYSYKFKNVQESISFSLEAGGYTSGPFKLNVIQKPLLTNLSIDLVYPLYTGKKIDHIENTGNITVLEGTNVKWKMTAKQTDTLFVNIDETKDKIKVAKPLLNDLFELEKNIKNATSYSISLTNSNIQKKNPIYYNIEVIKDKYPDIIAEFVNDTLLYQSIKIGGKIKDDYGFSNMRLIYKILDSENKIIKNNTIAIKINKSVPDQSFYFRWEIDSLNIKPGQTLSYYLIVWDNDGVNKPKATKSIVSNLKIPSLNTIKNQIEQDAEITENQLESTMSKALELKKEFEKLQNKIKSKNNLDWQDKKAIDDYIKKHDQLKRDVEKLSDLNKNLNEKHEKFSENEIKIAEKAEKLQELIENIMDEETKKLWEDLQKLLQEKNKDSEINDLLNKIDQKDGSIEKELDRAMEFYKQLQFDQKLEQNVRKLEELAKKQQNLSEKSNEKETSKENLQSEQENLMKEFDEIKKEIQDMKNINESLEEKHDLQKIDEQQKQIENKMNDSKNDLKNGNKKDAGKNQKDASEKMSQMANDLKKMSQSEESKAVEENIDDLRQILENLIKLSFDQEELMKNMKIVRKTDPKYLQLGQEQIKLKDDAKIIEDSLFALSKRVTEIKSFISKEVNSMKSEMEESAKLIKRREPYYASAKQQSAMTSINNLALMLDDVLKSLQDSKQQMQSNKSGNGSCNKPGSGNGKSGKKESKKPSPGQMQQQLNQQMKDMLGGGKSGNKMAEQLAKMAAQQEKIRKALQELEKMRKSNENGKGQQSKSSKGGDGKNGQNSSGGDADQIMKEMDKIEEEIVNKRINPELIKRQQDMTTRLLEFEKSIREREMEERRESKTGTEKNQTVPPSLQKYLQEKNRTLELIKTVPLNLTPYFNKKVNDFLNNLNQ